MARKMLFCRTCRAVQRKVLRRQAPWMVVVGLCVFAVLLFGQLSAGGDATLRQRTLGLDVSGPMPLHTHTPTRPPLPPLTTPTPYWLGDEYARRRLRADNVCSRLTAGSVERLTRFNNTSYCVVPKVGCTFWLNVFRFLHGDTGGRNVTSPFDIPRMVTHYGKRTNMRYFSRAPPHLEHDFRFMFVREPYSRLWSAYVDKFLLIDYWRHDEGEHIVKLRAKQHNTTRCAHDITFKEFLEFVSSHRNLKELNEHWRPVQYQCSPCLFLPHVIGKMETFAQDSRYVLQLMNASWVLDTHNHQVHVYQEMDMLITYNFQVLRKYWATLKRCTNNTDLSHRLWTTFQINGYIPRESRLPQPGPTGIGASQLQSLAHQAYRDRPHQSVAQWHDQREQMMLDAFRDVSTDTLHRLQEIYQQDFDLFGYDPQPDSIFGDRKKSLKSGVKV